MNPIDRDISEAFAALDQTAPDQPPDDFAARVLARLGDGASEDGSRAAPRALGGRESPPSPHEIPQAEARDVSVRGPLRGPREDSGLHDIKALASKAKQRFSDREQSESDVGESVLLTAAPGGLRAVALPDPSRADPAAERPDAPRAPREPTRTDSRSSLPFWVLGSVATLAAAAAVAVFVFGIGRDANGRDRREPGAQGGELAQVEPPPPGAPAASSSAAIEAPPAPPRAEDVAAAGESSPAAPPVVSRALKAPQDRAGAREEKRRAAEGPSGGRPGGEPDGKPGGKDGKEAAPAIAPDQPEDPLASDPAREPTPGGEPGEEGPGGEATLEEMLDAVTDDEARVQRPKAEPEKKPAEAPADEKKTLDRRAVSQALDHVRAEVQRCREVEQASGTVTVKFVVAPSGQVSSSAATGAHSRTRTGACVAKAVAQASFPAFDGALITFTYPFLLAR